MPARQHPGPVRDCRQHRSTAAGAGRTGLGTAGVARQWAAGRFILRRSEIAQSEVDPVPVDHAVADTQGRHRVHVRQGAAQRDDPAWHPRPSSPSSRSPSSTATTRPSRTPPNRSVRSCPKKRPDHGCRTRLDHHRGRRARLAPHGALPVPTAIPRDRPRSGSCWPPAPSSSRRAGRNSGGGRSRRHRLRPRSRRRQGSGLGLLAHELGADLFADPHRGVASRSVRYPAEKWLDRLTVAEARTSASQANSARIDGTEGRRRRRLRRTDPARRRRDRLGRRDRFQILDGTSGTRIVADPGPVGDDTVLLAVNGT